MGYLWLIRGGKKPPRGIVIIVSRALPSAFLFGAGSEVILVSNTPAVAVGKLQSHRHGRNPFYVGKFTLVNCF